MKTVAVTLGILSFLMLPPLAGALPDAEPPGSLAEAARFPDATPAIAAALARAGESGGGEVVLPVGRYIITRPLNVPSGVTLRGESKTATRLVVSGSADFSVLNVSGATDVVIGNLSIVQEGEGGKGAGIAIENGSRFVLVENVNIYGFGRGFSVGRIDDKPESANLTFRGCRAEKSRTFGFEFNNCREVLVDSCHAYYHWLDGIKFRKKARDITIRGGESSYNGVSRLVKENLNGNGVDAFAGGEGFLIDGLVCEHNQGSGIYMKTGGASVRNFGVVGNAMIANVRCRYNVGSGLDINRSGGDLANAPLLANVTVIGGIFEGNTASGIYVRGRNVSIVGPIIRSNDWHGIDLASAYEVTIINPLVSGNGRALKDGGYGIRIGVDPVKGGANNIRIQGGVIDGADDLYLVRASDPPPTAPVLHRRAILVGPEAANVSISGVQFVRWLENGEPVARPTTSETAASQP